MILDIIKEAYIKTFTEPRLSGRVPSEDFMKDWTKGINDCKSIEEMVKFLNASERHILLRIEKWESEPEVKLIDDEWQKV
jgi:hypothetical protein